MTGPKLSLVTGTVNRPDGIRKLLESIFKYTAVSFEVVIADSSDTPLICEDPRVRILSDRPRSGYVRAYNRAFAVCRGEWCLYLNDDAEVCPGYAEAAIAFMERNPQIGLGALYYSNRGMPACINAWCGMPYANFGILRRDLGNRIGWFWDAIKMYGSDNALTFDVLLSGLGVCGIREAQVIHHETDDRERERNQVGREQDKDKLDAKYLPRLPEMKRVYDRALAGIR